MCAIAGVFGHPKATELTAQMTAAQSHRGPDGGAVLPVAPDCALGHRRLAILDLSDHGSQPMTSRDGRWTVVLNGEVFNYRELRDELCGPWLSRTDTEVFLEGVSCWGLERTLNRSIGMFAVALWDRDERTLWLARDRIGEKPLVYFWDGHTLAFASEMRALAPLHASKLDPAAVDVYLGLGYVPAPLGIFRSTYKLPAGHCLRLHDGSIDVRRWWFPENATAEVARDPAGRREQTRALIGDAVRLRLRADVPIALALSGGVDSSVIAAELAQQEAFPDAFTVTFEDDATDLPYAQAVARKFGLRHHVIALDRQPIESELCAAMAQYDEPFADSSGVACVALAEALGGRYKVILDGDGGDEAFAGYRHYEYIQVKQALKAGAAAVGIGDGDAASTVYVESKTTFRASDRTKLLNGHGGQPAALRELLGMDAFLQVPRSGALKRALWSDRHLSLANGLTYKMDIALSAYGVEGRAPLLDHRILEWSQNLEDRDLVRGRDKKVLLRSAYADRLPPEILARRKHGFGAPIAQWLQGPLEAELRSLVPCPLLDSQAQRGQTGQQMWALFAFALWADRWGASW
ncbi:MAG: asparagine synthase (glutamine-hydrolyzing) [Acidobacteriota bacterium]